MFRLGLVHWVQTDNCGHYMVLYVNIFCMQSNWFIICIHMCTYTCIYLMYINFVLTADWSFVEKTSP